MTLSMGETAQVTHDRRLTARVVASPGVSPRRARWFRALCAGSVGVVALGSAANAASVSSHDAVNSFTAINSCVVFAAISAGLLASSKPVGHASGVTRHARAAAGRAALASALAAAAFAVVAAVIALPLLAVRGIHAPALGAVVAYAEREAIAGARVALIAAAVGIVLTGDRRRTVLATLAFFAGDGIAEALVPLLRDYGPVGAINAFSDPTHAHKLSLPVASLITFAWGLLALIAATMIVHRRSRSRSTG